MSKFKNIFTSYIINIINIINLFFCQVSTGATIPSTRMAAFIERRAHCLKLRQDHNDSFYS